MSIIFFCLVTLSVAKTLTHCPTGTIKLLLMAVMQGCGPLVGGSKWTLTPRQMTYMIGRWIYRGGIHYGIIFLLLCFHPLPNQCVQTSTFRITCKIPTGKYEKLLSLGIDEPSCNTSTDNLLQLLLSQQQE